MFNLWSWIVGNFKDLVGFLREHAVEISIKKKTTEEVTKKIVVTNLFVILCILVIVAVIYWFVKVHTILWP